MLTIELCDVHNVDGQGERGGPTIGEGKGGCASIGRRASARSPKPQAEELWPLPSGVRTKPLLQGYPCSKAGESAIAPKLHEALPRHPCRVQAEDEHRLRMEGDVEVDEQQGHP